MESPTEAEQQQCTIVVFKWLFLDDLAASFEAAAADPKFAGPRFVSGEKVAVPEKVAGIVQEVLGGGGQVGK